MIDALVAFLFKFRPVVFERGDIGFLTPWPWLLGGILAVAVAVPTVLRYRRVRARTTRRDRVVLSVLRIAALTVLLFSLARPVLVVSTVVPQQNFVGVLLDDSRSMQIADGGSPRSRFIQEQFSPGHPLYDGLAERFRVRLYRFAGAVEPVEDGAALGFAGSRSDLAGALDRVRAELSAVPLAGLVVATDGVDNGSGNLDEAVLALRASGVPVHTIGLGREVFSRDIELTRVNTPRRVLKGTSLVVDLLITQHGYDGRDVPVIVEDDGRIVASQQVTLADAGQAATVRVHFTVTEVGPRQFTFRVPPQDEELVEQNNVQHALIVVEDRRERILYFEGEPRFEVAFTRRAVLDDPNLHLVVLNRTAENKYLRLGVDDSLQLITGFPTTREELFTYSGLILGSVEASYFTHDQLRMIADFVGERGGGLLMLGGRRAFAEGGYAGTPVEDVLPVVLEQPEPSDFFAEVVVTPTPSGRTHPVTRIDDDEAVSAERWTRLPAVSIVNTVTRVKPGATALLKGEGDGLVDPQVVLAVERYGRGRALALPIQDTWIWQMHADVPIEDQTHETFWRQLLRFLVSGTPDRVSIALPSDAVAPGEPVRLLAEVDDDRYLRVNNSDVRTRVTTPTGEEWVAPMEWTVQRDGEYATTFVPDGTGLYRIAVETRDGGTYTEQASTWLNVADAAREFYDAEMRASLLRRVSEETGGRYYDPTSVAALPEEMQYTESGATVVEQHELRDMPILLLLVLGALSFEWGYRRWRGLV